MAEYKHFEMETRDDATIIRIKDHEFLDRLIGSELQEEMITFVKATQPNRLVVSFARVQRFSSETINALLRSREYVVAENGRMKLCELRKEIHNVFQVLNLEGSVFKIYDTVDDAIAAF